MRNSIKHLIWAGLTLCCVACGQAGGTETGTTDPGPDTSRIASRLEAAASALVPEIKASASQSSLVTSPLALTYGTETDWDAYLDTDAAYVLADIFGDPDETPQVVTKIRVLLDHFSTDLATLFAADPDLDCTGADGLDAETTLDIAFYGTIENGTASDAYFDCVRINTQTIIYGQDSAGTVRVVTMSDDTSDNAESTETRGTSVRIRQVVYATYAETTVDEVTTVSLDLQYTQATTYSGVDEEFGTNDDISFKSRSRITGQAAVTDAGAASLGTGEFAVTKYDRVSNGGGGTTELVTKTLGRGLYGSDDYSILDVSSNVGSLASSAGNYCIQMAADASTLPSLADATSCEDYETDFAWGTATFPFALNPELVADFEMVTFFEGDETDLISDDGSNFTIPTYTITATSTEE